MPHPDTSTLRPDRVAIDAAVHRILDRADDGARRVAVVGLSDRPHRTSHGVAAALQAMGWEVVPVNPEIESSLGVAAVASLADVVGPVDLVDVFRRTEHLEQVAREAAAIDVPALWNQLGLRSPAAAAIAADAGMDYVDDRCLKVEAARHRHRG